jgi:hypothetical protein
MRASISAVGHWFAMRSRVRDIAKMLKAIHAQESRKAAAEKMAAVIAELKAMATVLGLMPCYRLSCASEACPSRDIAAQCPAGQWIPVLQL